MSSGWTDPPRSRFLQHALALDLAVLGLEDEAADDRVPLDRGAQRDEEVALLVHDRLVAGLFREREGADRETLLAQWVGDRPEGVAAAEAADAELLVDDEGRPLARERLAVERDRDPGH